LSGSATISVNCGLGEGVDLTRERVYGGGLTGRRAMRKRGEELTNDREFADWGKKFSGREGEP